MPTDNVRPQPGLIPLLRQEEDVEHKSQEQKPASKPSSFITRIGFYAIGTLVLGSIIILASHAYLTFLWYSHSKSWSWIVLKTWVAPSVTLASLAIRTSINLQAIVCTSIIAALALQWHQVDTAESTAVSLLRFTNPGPYSLVMSLLSSNGKGLPMAGILVVCLALVVLFSNAISTALVSDLDIAVLAGDNSRTHLAFGVNVTKARFANQSSYLDPPALYKRKPYQYPSFAELRFTNETTSSSVHDTSLVLSAFLPKVSSADRSRVKTYNGTAATLMTRSICVRPQLNMTLDEAQNDEGVTLTGRISPDPDEEWSDVFDRTASEDLNCFLLKEDPFRVCNLTTDESVLGLNSNSSKFDMSHMYQYVGDPSEMNFEKYLVWISKETQELQSSGITSEWLYVDRSNASTSLSAGYASLCFTLESDQYIEISASRPENITEPSLEWFRFDNDTEPDAIDTRKIRKQLGVNGTTFTLQQRGLLSLDSWSHPTSPVLQAYFDGLTKRNGTWGFKYEWSQFLQGVTIDWTNSWDWAGGGFDFNVWAIVFKTLVSTNHPALMFQALNMLLYPMAYYNEYDAFDLYDPSAQIQYFVTALQPVRNYGYWIVATVIACHFLLVVTVFTLYIAGSGDGDVLGQAWAAMTQLKSEEVEYIRQKNEVLTDQAVRELLKKEGLQQRKVGLVYDESQGYTIKSLH